MHIIRFSSRTKSCKDQDFLSKKPKNPNKGLSAFSFNSDKMKKLKMLCFFLKTTF